MGTMPIENTTGDYDLTGTGSIVFTYNTDRAMDVRVCILVGSDAHPCVMLAGTWVLYVWVTRYGNTEVYAVEPYPQSYRCYVNKCKFFTTKVVDIEYGDSITVAISSPNVGDTEVTVYASMVQVLAAIPEARPGDAHGIVTFGIGAGQVNADGTGQVPSSNAALAASYTEYRAGLLDNLNATVGSRSSHSAADVWTSGTRTLSSFGTLVADIATAVWGAVARTLTTLSGLGHATATGQDEIKTAVGLVGNSQDTITNSESQVYNTDTADGSTVVNEES